MVRIANAIYQNGMLKLDGPLPISENSRVTVTISNEELSERHPVTEDREAARQRLLDALATPIFNIGGKMPSRDEMHERD